MGILLLFVNKPSTGHTGATTSAYTLTINVNGGSPPASGEVYPAIVYDVAFASQPLAPVPSWVDMSDRLRSVATQRGRSYEFDRMETGTLGVTLDNRDAALSPENTGSPFTPLKSTRPVRAQLRWATGSYPLFRGISEGFPLSYPSFGADALVQQQANDLFYALNRARFTPGSTTLTADLDTTSTSVSVASTVLPLPEVVPFEVTIDAGLANAETVTVTEIASATSYTVTRATESFAHSSGASVSTTVVSFGEEMSGSRIRRVLEAVGFDSSWYDLDAGQTLIAGSGDLASLSPLEHIALVVEAEFGRFFVSRSGAFTFRDRSSVILDYLNPVMTFSDGTVAGVPYSIEGALEHSEEKLYNRVKITTPSGFVADISDAASIADHFERVFEREWPYANDNDATSAAHFVLMRSVVHSVRLPALSTAPARDPNVLWPLVLSREIGDRCRFYYQPDAGDAIDREVIIEGIEHQIRPGEHRVRFQLTEADPNEYWILGLAGYGELGETTWVGF